MKQKISKQLGQIFRSIFNRPLDTSIAADNLWLKEAILSAPSDSYVDREELAEDIIHYSIYLSLKQIQDELDLIKLSKDGSWEVVGERFYVRAHQFAKRQLVGLCDPGDVERVASRSLVVEGLPDRTMTTSDVMRLTQLSRETLHRYRKSGKLKAYYLEGGLIRYDIDSVEALLSYKADKKAIRPKRKSKVLQNKGH